MWGSTVNVRLMVCYCVGEGESPKMSWGNMSSDMSAVSPQSAISRVSSSTFSKSY